MQNQDQNPAIKDESMKISYFLFAALLPTPSGLACHLHSDVACHLA